MPIEVPETFKAIGFSGFFHTETGFHDDETRESFRAKAPCLLKDPGWMLLCVNENGTGTLVRKDIHAFLDAYSGHS